MEFVLKSNGHGDSLIGSGYNYLQLENVEPMYKIFLEHLREEAESLVLEIADGDNDGLPLFVKYESKDGISDFLQSNALKYSCNCSLARKGRYKSNKTRIRKNSKAQRCILAAGKNGGLQTFRNRKSADKRNTESNTGIDGGYEEFLSCVKIRDGSMALEYQSFTVIYEGEASDEAKKLTNDGNVLDGQGPMHLESTRSVDSMKTTNEGIACSDMHEITLHEGTLPPDVVIYGGDDNSLAPSVLPISSPFDLKLKAVLRKPYDGHEHEVLWNQANFRKPVLRHKDLRNQSKSFHTMQMGLSYLDYYPELARKLERSDPQQAMALLRGFFFWLENLCHEGAYQPWAASSSSNIIEISEHDSEAVLPVEGENICIEAESSPSPLLPQ